MNTNTGEKLDESKTNGLITKIWGPHLWFSLNSIVFGFPVKPTLEQKQQYITFFKSLGWVLPCSHCRESYNFFINDLVEQMDQ